MLGFLSLDEDVVQNVTETQNTFENIILIHDGQTVNPRFSYGVKYCIQTII